MSVNLPESELPDVREYLYVDVPRVRALLAQVDAGVADSSAATTERTRKLRAAMGRLFGADSERSESAQQTRSLSDLHVAMLEEQATALGLLRDISDEVDRAKRWKRGHVRKALGEGALIRVTAPTRLFDPRAVAGTLARWSTAMDDQDGFGEMVDGFVGALYGSHLSLRLLPCGEGEPECSFIGLIADTHGYIGAERDALFSRLGGDLSEWTTLAQVGRLPGPRPGGPVDLSSLGQGLEARMRQSDRLDRHAIDRFLVEIMQALEQFGMQEAPRHPTISVVPLAVYRHVLPTQEIEPVPDEDEPDA